MGPGIIMSKIHCVSTELSSFYTVHYSFSPQLSVEGPMDTLFTDEESKAQNGWITFPSYPASGQQCQVCLIQTQALNPYWSCSWGDTVICLQKHGPKLLTIKAELRLGVRYEEDLEIGERKESISTQDTWERKGRDREDYDMAVDQTGAFNVAGVRVPD